MKHALFAGALALAVTLGSTAALADDPNDPAMRNATARARDRDTIRALNRAQLAKVQARDAGYAEGWRAYRGGDAAHENARRRADYNRQMAEWRRAVAACRAGQYEYCGG